MSHFAANPGPNHRAQLLAEAVVSAYIDEIARSGRRQHRAACAPEPTATRSKTAVVRRRALTRRHRPLAVEVGA